ncbi:MAG: Flp pilus assembly complex ATPase component TadA [Actinomycetota bacterium]|nr:Flp pilus assembly complex ATPase component TadA [Actinomycetota bacterium]
MPRGNQLGAVLVKEGLLTQEELDGALAEQAATEKLLGRILLDNGLIEEVDLAMALATQLGLDYVELSDYAIDASAAGTITNSVARRYRALPIGWEEGRLVVAMADAGNVVAIDDLRTMTKSKLKVVVATESSLLEAVDRYQRMDGDAESISAQAASELEIEEDLAQVTALVEDAPIVKLVNMLITQAVADRASDIHIEPSERDVRVRYRIDGVLHDVMRPPKSIQPGMVSRLKIMADINIAERRVPQDGRVNISLGGKPVDLRVTTLPTVYGEKIVLRVLDRRTAVLNLSDLGFLPSSMERFERSFRQPYGTILVTGPTGSGKSTTLYATLNILNDDTKNIITVEDPVEYRLAGVNQIQTNNKAGMTFATALRSILRADPDIVLVGEIRDRETANIAIEAALTGHLVLSTLHTNDASSTPTRLVEMGVEPFLVASALDCIVAQRLARRLCPKCKQAYRPTGAELQTAGWDNGSDGERPELFRPGGCPACGKTGYHGRFALHEVLTVTEEIERLIVDRQHSEDINKTARAQGMLTLRQAGLTHVARGLTSLEEILRVVG